MRIICALCGLFLAIATVNCSPIVKRETEEDLSPLNEVYVMEVNDEGADGERSDRDKRKIGIKLGVANGILDFVFNKVDSFIVSKTKALEVLDDSNRAKNAAFGIDPHSSSTKQFLNNLVAQKIKAATGSIGPIINSATTLFSGAAAGLSNALASKVGSLSSLSGGLSGGAGASTGDTAGGSHGGSQGGSIAGSAIIGDLLTTKLSSLSSLSQSSGDSSGSHGSGSSETNTSNGHSAGASAGANAGAGTGINLGAFANLAGKTTTEDTPIFDRTRVSLEIPSSTFGTGFTLITNISKILNSVILNSARRTQTFLEIFKPFFRGAFEIKGLPSDNPK